MMSALMYQQRKCSLGKLFNSTVKSTVKRKIFNWSRGNIYNINSLRRDPILNKKIEFRVGKRSISKLFFRKPTVGELKIKDNVPDEYTMIYRSTLDRYLLYSQLITTGTAFIVALIAIYKNDFSDPALRLDFSDARTPIRHTDNEIYVYVTAFFTISVILQLMISRLPIRIYNLPQQKRYIFVFHGNYPFTKRKLICKVGDVVPSPTESKIVPWLENQYLVKNQQKLILFEHCFQRPADLHIMLGLQRDPNVKEDEEI